MFTYVIFGFAAVLGAAASILIGLLLARRTVLSLVAQGALAVASGLLVVGLFSSSVGFALHHRVYVPSTGMDETGAGVIFVVALVFGSASALFFGLSTVLWERLKKK